MSESLVVAFGGNAILPAGQRGTMEEQRANVRHMSAQLGTLILGGYRVVVTHGNGPQVGEIMLASDVARDLVSPLTLDIAGAMSQGQIGYLLQTEIENYLTAHGMSQSVFCVVTRVLVDPADRGFDTPTKPIGRFYGRDEADQLSAARGWHMVEDAGRGYRRVVPSPVPQEVIEWPAVKALVDSGALVIAAGGGGIPVVKDSDGSLHGVEAVIDKDLSAQRLASLVGADTLVLLTEVEHVAVDFGTPSEHALRTVTRDQMEAYYQEGQFPPGSMGPKVRAAVDFLRSGGERAIITCADRLVSAVVQRDAGTQILASVPARTSRGQSAVTGG